MTRVIIATIFVLVCSCSLSDAIAPQLSVGRVADLTHHITKRQATPTLQDIADCTAAIVDYQCGSSGYAQQVLNIALGCRNDTYARNVANTCARSENGEFCGTATIRFSLDQTQTSTACQGAVSSGSCPSSCRSFLQSASSTLGCCINTYINTTVSPLLGLYGEYVDYRLWSLCNVPLPPADCGNGLPLNPPQDSQVCTLQELFTRFANYECMESVGQGLVDTLLQNSRCYIYARSAVEACSINENNEFCAAVVGSNLIDSGSSTDSNFISLVNNCASSSSSFCSSSCQNAVTTIANSYGCCVNVYNISIGGNQVPQLSYGLWNRCGVNTPGFCSASTLSGAATIKVLFAWMIALAMAALYI